ncbi:hypothetical protein D3C86_1719710 [compost metagenome]
MQVDRQRQPQFQLCTRREVIDRAQIDLRGDQRCGECLDLEQLLAHALIAQGDAAVHRLQLDFHLGQARGADLAVQYQKALHFGNVGVFGADER